MGEARSFVSGALAAASAGTPGGKMIGTHNGDFQADEALACGMLLLLPEYCQATVVRTRDADKLRLCDIVVDVGGEHDEGKRRFDHHQRGFAETMPGRGTILSAAGLVYRWAGKQILRVLCPAAEEEEIEAMFKAIYTKMIEGIDADDTGTAVKTPAIGTDLAARVKRLNTPWNADPEEDSQQRRFEDAAKLCQEEFLDVVYHVHRVWWPARAAVARAIAAAGATGIMALPHDLPAMEHVYELERSLKPPARICFLTYPQKDGSFFVRAINEEGAGFALRAALPAAWRGLKGEALVATWQAEVGEGSPLVVPPADQLFVHGNGFCGGHTTEAGALAMAQAGVAEASA